MPMRLTSPAPGSLTQNATVKVSSRLKPAAGGAVIAEVGLEVNAIAERSSSICALSVSA
jgi:hypothetical protein